MTSTAWGGGRDSRQVPTILLLGLGVMALGVLLLVLVTPLQAAMAGATAGIAARVALIAADRRRPRDVVVVGDADFCESVRSGAGRHRRISAAWVVDATREAWDHAPRLPRCDEVVIDGRLFERVRAAAPEVLRSGRLLRVVERGRDASTVFKESLGTVSSAVKRALDVAVALVLGFLLLPVLLAAIMAIKLDSPGPVLFIRTRLGVHGRLFRMYKLRTMTVASDDTDDRQWLQAMVLGRVQAEGGLFKPPHSQRITRVGRVLRRLSMDEIPQLWNVLRGDMSLVGPRPPLVDEADVYDDRTWQRLRARPGITGLAQISGRSALCFDEIVELDLEYLEHGSLALDIKILVKTPVVLLTGRGAR